MTARRSVGLDSFTEDESLTLVRKLRGEVAALGWAEQAEQQVRQQEQIKQYRVRHRRVAFLADLEARWAVLAAGT